MEHRTLSAVFSRGPRVLTAGLVATAVMAGAAGCRLTSGAASISAGSTSSATPAASGPGATPAAGPLAGLTADQIAVRAITGLRTATSVHVTGTVTDTGQQMRLSLSLARGRGCRGGMTLVGKGSFRLIMIGRTVWIKPDRRFWRLEGGTNAGALALLLGKWLRVQANHGLGSLAQLCQPAVLAGNFRGVAGLVKGPTVMVSGRPALQLRTGPMAGGTGAGVMDVSLGRQPEILRLTQNGRDGGQLGFSGYGAPVTITPPPAGQTLDGSKFGL
jgi:hypothetical protein